jgi:hypothetical protein
MKIVLDHEGNTLTPRVILIIAASCLYSSLRSFCPVVGVDDLTKL